ncbi:ATP-binding cassette domain-containing protein [Brachyspira aalborgi]|jgi:ABC-2 type transport system ATP-binding protein|uniref:ATP-binding cassette domain-containing protein n=1 Tax=Brachyspira aalborgi TaxID=29522 RepID=A0A5C8EWV4_9SPIR|nr:ATP-binding cassette domain-containing protein [Brachyspira aalborgi]MBS4763692.1 ATP-binding cassette domain-containing protein [Brachyspira sp.]CCY77469.1 aBC-type multidrug transport system ATPase component [Brachyspira sp. CAG:700]TXJ17248.1 ATP-binding cassette domain-containing protein [Brachyspira aalborgi]TXJ22535.1 ATP-binding cassette domain-containing protein [Brachyspira aalborgi]TXJ27795.1 ATP-binding cassette domain-containing protein [Brachyspira aalborgi]
MISVKNLTKYYGDFQALKGISFEIKSGEIVGILGPNGAGKSTTLRILTCYFNPTSGDAIIDGKSILDEENNVKKIIGYLPESAPLYNDMCVFDYLVYMADIQELERSKLNERLHYVVNVCGLKEVISKPIGELSKGYKQRVGLAGAIIHDPKILILDEPTNGLDPNQIVEIRELIKELGKEKTVLVSTHILSEVEATCSRAIIINKGNIIADDTPENLSLNFGNNDKSSTIKISIKTNDNIESVKEKLLSVSDIYKVEIEDNFNNIKELTIYSNSEEPRDEIYRFIKSTDWIIYEMTRVKENLETVFHTLTKGDE